MNDIYHPKKVIHPEIKYWDLPPLDRESASSNQILSGRQRNILQAADALFLVVRTFEDPALLHPLETIDPGRDVSMLLEELALADLQSFGKGGEKRLAMASRRPSRLTGRRWFLSLKRFKKSKLLWKMEYLLNHRNLLLQKRWLLLIFPNTNQQACDGGFQYWGI
ncbi:MAG: hypothetical protein Ct9H300mP11_08640 [Chloroflexota bacterium]|nr:MAG: hypothetical protein Ct9H300mP11_08640 [Chloroflexota bacterium]